MFLKIDCYAICFLTPLLPNCLCERKHTFWTTIDCKQQLFIGSHRPWICQLLKGTFPLARNSSPRYESPSRAVLSIYKFLKIDSYAICYLTQIFPNCLWTRTHSPNGNWLYTSIVHKLPSILVFCQLLKGSFPPATNPSPRHESPSRAVLSIYK